jgi:hypothetical protein
MTCHHGRQGRRRDAPSKSVADLDNDYHAARPTIPEFLESEECIKGFLALLPGLWRGFEPGLRRGGPPSFLRQWWNRLVYGKE